MAVAFRILNYVRSWINALHVPRLLLEMHVHISYILFAVLQKSASTEYAHACWRLDVSFFDFDFRQQLPKNVHFGNIFETTTFEFLDISPYPENIHCALNRQVLDATTGGCSQ